jgi:4-amino-4-deoxy-L-arabinose transferase-like glycosyltransferase
VQRFLVRLIAVCAALLWVLPMHSSLWLDETGTFWIAKDRIADAIARAWFWSGQSPFYYLIAWLALRVGGTSEIILRTPSLVCMAGATAILVFAGARLIDRETGLLGALVFVCFEETVFAASDARPYALALLMLMAQMLMLLRWLDRGRFRDAAAYAIFAALTVYAHPLFAVGLVAPALYALWRSSQKLAVAATWIATAVLCLPLAPQLLDFYRNRQSKTFTGTPHANQFFESLTPATAVTSILSGLLLAYLLIPGITVRWPADRPKTMLLTAWAVFTPAVYFALGLFTDIKPFLPRYCLSMAPGLALLAGCAIRSFAPDRARRIMACSLALLAVAAFGVMARFNHGHEDWRGAMQAVRSVAGGTDIPVLVVSRFVEASGPAQLADPKLKDILFSPLTIYPAAGKVVRLPSRVDDAYLEQVVTTVLRNQSSFLMVDLSDSAVAPWLRGRLAPRAPAVQHLGNFGNVDVRLFRLSANPLPGAEGGPSGNEASAGHDDAGRRL